jgi:hypothetical protein
VEPWICDNVAVFRCNTHIKADYSTAAAKVGKQLTCSDERMLRLLLMHWCGWSAIDPSDMQGSWVRYI